VTDLPPRSHRRRRPDRSGGVLPWARPGKGFVAWVGALVVLLVLGLVAGVLSVTWAGCNRGSDAGAPPNAGASDPAPAPPPQGPAREPDPGGDDPSGPAAPLTGLPPSGEAEEMNRRALMVSIDNHRLARPQTGLDRADLVFEVPCEGGITRFLAVYHSRDAETIGPVRSGRDYMLRLAAGLDAVYCHVGGSPQYYTLRQKLGWEAVDDMRVRGAFWRSSRVDPPHNLYTSTDRLRRVADRLGHRLEGPPPALLSFADPGSGSTTPPQPTTALTIRHPGPAGYRITYRRGEDGRWHRWSDGRPHRDAADDKPQLAAANVIVQFTRVTPIPGDTEGRVNVDLRCGGRAVYLTAGGLTEGAWTTVDDPPGLGYRDGQGREMQFSPGTTWIHIVPEGTPLDIEDAGATD